MFRITAETCQAFTFAEILIMAAINVLVQKPLKLKALSTLPKIVRLDEMGDRPRRNAHCRY